MVQNNKLGTILSLDDISSNYGITLKCKLGISYFIRGNIAMSEQYFDDVLNANSEYIEAFIGKGRCFLKRNKLKEAVSHFSKGISKFPQCGEIYRNLGNTYLEQENYNNAISLLKESIEIMPNSALANNNLGYVFQKVEKYIDAMKYHNNAVKLDPILWEAYADRAKCHLKLGNSEEAQTDIFTANDIKERYDSSKWEWIKFSNSTNIKVD